MRKLALLLALLAGLVRAEPIVLVIDPGHGDRAAGGVQADPGASAESLYGTAWECVFTWDTSMRLRERALQDGARVFLTLEDPANDYRPHAWRPDRFPGLEEYRFKTLVDVPHPADNTEALSSRVATANRIYEEYSDRCPVYFISFHFDSTAPELAGISFYYPPGREGSLRAPLEDAIRDSGRARCSLSTGSERGLSQSHAFAVLSQSVNPNSYLIELGNIRSQDENGGNPDLWRMRSPEVRQEYAELVWRALQSDDGPPPLQRPWRLRYTLALMAGSLLLLGWLGARSFGEVHKAPGTKPQVEGNRGEVSGLEPGGAASARQEGGASAGAHPR